MIQSITILGFHSIVTLKVGDQIEGEDERNEIDAVEWRGWQRCRQGYGTNIVQECIVTHHYKRQSLKTLIIHCVCSTIHS